MNFRQGVSVGYPLDKTAQKKKEREKRGGVVEYKKTGKA